MGTGVSHARQVFLRKVLNVLLFGTLVLLYALLRCLEILVPSEHRSELDTIIALRLDGSAADLDLAPITSGQLTFGKDVTASHVYTNRRPRMKHR